MGPSWRPSIKQEAASFSVPPSRPSNGRLGLSWSALGALLGALGPVLGLSWARLGALLGHLGAILRPQEPIESEKARRQQTLIFLRCLKEFGLSGASLGGSVASWGRLWALLGRCWGPLGALWKGLGGLLGLSWRPSIKKEVASFSPPPSEPANEPLGALLGRSWARLWPFLGPSWGSLGPSWGHLEASRAH